MYASSNHSFNLDESKAKGPPMRGASKYYTDEEIQEKLKGYTRLSREEFENVRPGTHIRYVRNDGNFRAGGFVTCNPLKTKETEGSRTYMLMRNDIRPRCKGLIQWVIYYDEIQDIYSKAIPCGCGGSEETERRMKEMREHIDRLEESNRDMREKINEALRKVSRNFARADKRMERLEALAREARDSDTISVAGSTVSSIHPICQDIMEGRYR